ncbi:Putative odorant-binding protein A10 [Camponotus floridanus]|uniref:Putative odorant-binding protein A10 n=1 Tax=Camponotus floridanus TaxID=104421 RepID=E2A1S1_CAMFO|nr:putative odorant-binding protein A10 [Camponotus floridanus]EFN72617.1 Putative odorant-binding protein A10 [Camponotus floridanus]
MARLICTIAIISIALMCVLAEEEKYEDKYDDIDVHEILQNAKLREQYYKCFMVTGPCVTADAKFFNKILSEALQTKCKLCTEKQKYMLDELSDWYTKNEPAKWDALVAKSLENMKKKAKE